MKLRDEHVHLVAAGRITWCRRAWMGRRSKRRRRRQKRLRRRTCEISRVTCPDCQAAWVAEQLVREGFRGGPE